MGFKVYAPDKEVIQGVLEFFEKHKDRRICRVGISPKEAVTFLRAEMPRLRELLRG